MLDLIVLIMEGSERHNTAIIAIMNFFFLIIFWGGSLFNIILFSLFAMTGFIFFTSLSYMVRIKNEKPSINFSEQLNEVTKKVSARNLATSYKKTSLLNGIAFLCIIFIRLTNIDVNWIKSSGSEAFVQQFANPYIPSFIELFLISIIVVLSVSFPYYFCNWVGNKFFIINPGTEEGKLPEYKIKYLFPLAFFLIALFTTSLGLNMLYIDANINSSSLVGIEFIIPYVNYLLLFQTLLLAGIIVVLKLSLPKIPEEEIISNTNYTV